ncbi:hypothetical protein CEP54_001349 [Fusarium duplospermum]|uniref:Uncharacterized protein n=1 Tax=Fusarium duplospermum TaxID=1325734 RepID=A0A428R1T9_9HYPO|nr:hypothetical protein CEP54_001349 [Fusarium duplospermum]
MHPPLWLIYLFIILACVVAVSAQDYGYESCRHKLEAIIVGNTTKDGINNETVLDYLWTGAITGFRGQTRPRALGYEGLMLNVIGCLKICGGRTDQVTTRSTLEMVTTWIFPLAIVFNLPYDSLHHHKIRRTAQAVLNWAGSPQTALTHTVWNVRQIRHCHRMAKSKNGTLNNDAFYVLSCLGQFELPNSERFYTALVYGLFRPFPQPDTEYDPDQHYTAQLLLDVAFQLRMLRRRGVIPTLASLGTFITAFIFSIVLAFDEEAGNRTGSPLTLGLLYCWLPLLVIFTIIDRNPVSADRSAALMSRWLFNVDAVLTSARAAGADLNNMETPTWWSRNRSAADREIFEVQEFIGQGRKIKYCGLADAMIRTIRALQQQKRPLGNNLDQYRLCAQTVLGHLNGTRPTQWWVTAVVSLFLVVFEVMMAFLVAFCTPTFGLGCWSGGLLLYGVLSSVTWVIHFCVKAPGKWGQIICSCFNFLALGWIITLTGFVLAGGFRTCWCSTVKLSSGGYMMFESFDYYVKNFAMDGPWISASVLGGLVPGAVLVTATAWWMKCQHLWSTEETEPVQGIALGNVNFKADTSWLRA